MKSPVSGSRSEPVASGIPVTSLFLGGTSLRSVGVDDIRTDCISTFWLRKWNEHSGNVRRDSGVLLKYCSSLKNVL